MPFNTQWSEKMDSRPANVGRADQSADLVFIGQNTVAVDDDNDANQSLISILPLVYPGSGYATLTFQGYQITNQGNGVWQATAHYTRQVNLFTFEIGGASQTITQSIQTYNSYAPEGQTAPNFNGAIGVDGDRIKGVEIQTPTFEWEETYHFNPSMINQDYYVQLANLMASPMNLAPFRGFAASEVLLRGARGSQKGLEDVEITFKFSRSARRTNFIIGRTNPDGTAAADAITVGLKDGWDYMWILYQPTLDSTTNVMVQKPVAVYVEQVYQLGDFSALQIGS
jgi:hypothetical protein